jgi:hypothetical protein
MTTRTSIVPPSSSLTVNSKSNLPPRSTGGSASPLRYCCYSSDGNVVLAAITFSFQSTAPFSSIQGSLRLADARGLSHVLSPHGFSALIFYVGSSENQKKNEPRRSDGDRYSPNEDHGQYGDQAQRDQHDDEELVAGVLNPDAGSGIQCPFIWKGGATRCDDQQDAADVGNCGPPDPERRRSLQALLG